MSVIEKLNAAIKAVCPIHGVSIGTLADKLTWRIDFKPEATSAERTAAQGALDAFDVAAASAPEVGLRAPQRDRAAKVEELERRMSRGAPQEEVNAAILDLLKE